MKISEDKLKEGRELAAKHKFTKLFVNVFGEFFTNPSYAAMSVKYDKEKFAEVPLTSDQSQSQSTEKATNASTGSATNDLGKAADVIAAIEAAIGGEAVVAIMKAEAEGKNRKSVIDAGKKKLDAIAQAATSPAAEDGKPENVTLAAIEEETEVTAVAALLELEKLGKNRPEVIEAATKKIETLTKKAE